MAKFVRIENDQIIECLDYLPHNHQGDWREAIDIVPHLIPFKQIQGPHSFDISKTPVEIVWSVIDLTLDERKQTIVSITTGELQNEVGKELNKDLSDANQNINFQLIESLVNQIRSKKFEIDAIQTHEEMDQYIQNNNIVP
jgi:hypothetical protein